MAYNFDKETQVGNWEVKVDTAAFYGYFENVETGDGGGLWFDGESVSEPTVLSITDYDGLSVLPRQVSTALENMSIEVGEDFK